MNENDENKKIDSDEFSDNDKNIINASTNIDDIDEVLEEAYR